jgi:hypothetical protein
MISIFHWPPAKVSIGIKVDHLGAAYLSIAACRPPDVFTKARATDENLSKKLLGPARDAVRSLKRRRSMKDILEVVCRGVGATVQPKKTTYLRRSPLRQTH